MSEKEQDPGQSGVLTTKMEGVEAVSKEEIEKILKQVDKEASARKLTGTSHWIVYVIGVSWSIFQVYTAAFGLLPAQLQRSIHLAYAFVLTYLLFPARAGDEDNRLRWYNWVLAAFACYIGLYMALNYMRIMEAGGDYSQHGLYRRRLRHPAHAGGGAPGGGAADRLPGDIFSALLLFRGLFPRIHVAPRVFP